MSEEAKYRKGAEAARILSVSQQTLVRWADEGSIKHIILPSGHRRYQVEDFIVASSGKRKPNLDKDLASEVATKRENILRNGNE